jgi:hypothetical protein
MKRVKGQYPTIDIWWNDQAKQFQIMENYNEGATTAQRMIAVYQNDDGTPAPIIGDRVMEFLQRADTRKWPLEERMKVYDRERKEKVERDEKEFSEYVQTTIKEDYNYIAGIPTFFMNPKFNFKAVGAPE